MVFNDLRSSESAVNVRHLREVYSILWTSFQFYMKKNCHFTPIQLALVTISDYATTLSVLDSIARSVISPRYSAQWR